MPALTYPGVYVQEISGGVRPLETASTSTAAFVGLSEMGPDNTAQRITSWTEFQRVYGGFFTDGYLPHSVFAYFNNGGRQCYILRVTRSDAAAASVVVANRAPAPLDGLTLTAKSKGAWGNSLYVQIEDGTLDPGNEFRLSIRRQDDPAVVPTTFRDIPPIEVFDNLSTDRTAPNYVGSVRELQSALLGASVPRTDDSVQRGIHRGGPDPLLPLNALRALQIELDSDGLRTITLPASAGTATALADVATAIQTAVRALAPLKASTDPAADTGFTCAADTGTPRLVLQSGTTSATSSVGVQSGGGADATFRLRLGAGNGGRSESGAAVRRPALADVVQIGDAAISPPVSAVTRGIDGIADVSEATFAAENVTDVSLLAVPGEATPDMTNRGMSYCANRPLQDMFYLGETAMTDDSPADASLFRARLTAPNSFGGVYFPWVLGADPTGVSPTPVPIPPSGYVARGVWKAPAGVEATLNGVSGLTAVLSDVEHGVLNPLGVNALRSFPTAGVVAFGARTVSSLPEWKYVPVRRTAIMLRVSIYYGIQWAVFEPNDEPLWSQLRLSIGSFMTTLFRQGAFQDASPAEAFFVKCDADTTTQADIDLGVVNVLVGFAPLKPAEFVVVKISQSAGQASG